MNETTEMNEEIEVEIEQSNPWEEAYQRKLEQVNGNTTEVTATEVNDAIETATSGFESAFDFLNKPVTPRVAYRVYNGGKGSVYVDTTELGTFDVETRSALMLAGNNIQTAKVQTATLVKVVQHTYVSSDVVPLADIANESDLKKLYNVRTVYFAIFESGNVYRASYNADSETWRVDRSQLTVERDGKRYNAQDVTLARQAVKHLRLIEAGSTTNHHADNRAYVRDTSIGQPDAAVIHYFTARAMLKLDDDDTDL